jgi:ABC-2 type transport system permease protein
VSLPHVARVLPDLFRVSAAEVFAWRAELVLWVLTATFPLLQLALWNTVAAEGPVAGMDQDAIARWFAGTLLVRQLTASWVAWSLSYEIRSGALSPRLLKPIHPLWHYAAQMVLAMPIRMAVLAPVLVPLLWWRPSLLAWPGAPAMACFALSVALAWLLLFLVQSLVGIAAFWVDKTDSLFMLWFAIWTVASGYAAPMAVFPDWLRAVATWLPFRATLATPVELLGGFLSPADAVPDLVIQGAWVVVLLGAVSVAWRRGLVRYGAFGA